jgi:HSP20 family molecular chaperone IbpA
MNTVKADLNNGILTVVVAKIRENNAKTAKTVATNGDSADEL